MIQGLIDIVQLRAEIGSPTKDQSEPGYVSDDMLQEIIDRHEEEATRMADALVNASVMETGLPGPASIFEEVEIQTTSNGPVYVGTIDEQYYPQPLKVVDNEDVSLVRDPNVFRTANTAPFDRYAYQVVGNKIEAISKDPSELKCQLAIKSRLYSHYIQGEILNNFNNAIINAATTMLSKRIAEGTRLEQDMLTTRIGPER